VPPSRSARDERKDGRWIRSLRGRAGTARGRLGRQRGGSRALQADGLCAAKPRLAAARCAALTTANPDGSAARTVGCHAQDPPPAGSAAQELRFVRASVHLAKEVGTRLAGRQVLLGRLPASRSTTIGRTGAVKAKRGRRLGPRVGSRSSIDAGSGVQRPFVMWRLTRRLPTTKRRAADSRGSEIRRADED
jgi:hypothetical protein